MDKWIAMFFVLTLAVCTSGCRESAQEGYNDVQPAAADAAPPTIPSADTPKADNETLVPEDLLHRRFALDSVDGREIAIEDRNLRPDIEFNEGFQIAGRICNRYRGPAELKNGKLHADNLAASRMLCVNPELNELEQLFFSMLRAGADVTLADDGMALSQGGRVLSYSRADWVR